MIVEKKNRKLCLISKFILIRFRQRLTHLTAMVTLVRLIFPAIVFLQRFPEKIKKNEGGKKRKFWFFRALYIPTIRADDGTGLTFRNKVFTR